MSANDVRPGPGAQYLGERRCRFGLWAPACQSVEVHIVHPYEKTEKMQRDGEGYFSAIVENIEPGCRYFYRLDGTPGRPDPASRFQPEGCQGASEVIDPHFSWNDSFWCGIPLQDYILYELHVGTFTPEGTFDAAITRLDYLKNLGITAVEIMPIAQFPGTRNWGYDGVFPYAVNAGYGGPSGLKRFVDAAHARGLAVVLDVVYNHIGPEGRSLAGFGPYFSQKYFSPWGPVFNYDANQSDAVRRFFIDNALEWIDEYHMDGLRLDAVSAIYDASARPFLEELSDEIHAYGQKRNRLVYAIAETAANDPRFVRQKELGGMGLDAQWNFDFHHALHRVLTGESCGYYGDYEGVEALAKALREGYVYTGEHSAYWGRRHGASSERLSARKFVVYSQNHDETGNRPQGERYGSLLSAEAQKLAAGIVLLSPFLPLLFMGEEYGETAPFLFFADPQASAARSDTVEGRKREARAFGWTESCVDPLSEETFQRSKLNWDLCQRGKHQMHLAFYKELLRLRKECPGLQAPSKEGTEVHVLGNGAIIRMVRKGKNGQTACALFHFGDTAYDGPLPIPAGRWERLMESCQQRWGGPGETAPERLTGASEIMIELAPKSFVLYGGS